MYKSKSPPTAPTRREYNYGYKAYKKDAPKTANPWRRTINGRDYHAFEYWWDKGWETAKEGTRD